MLTRASERLRKKEEISPLMSLSDLPENVIDDIISRLPAKDAGRTAVLSRSWRHRWRYIPDLDLSKTSDLGVSQVLRFHVGPIRLFKVQTDDACASDHWLAALASSSSSGCLHTLDLSYGRRFQLGTLARSFPRLVHLRLTGDTITMLPELDSSEFATLRTLHLEYLYDSGDYFCELQFSKFVPACPLLVTLTVLECNGSAEQNFHYDLNSIARDYPRLTHLHVSSGFVFTIPPSSYVLTSLRTLYLRSGLIYGKLSVILSVCPLLENLTVNGAHLDWEECIDIVAPNLRYIELVDAGQVAGFSITGAPNLETAVLGLGVDATVDSSDGETSTNCNMIKVLAGMPCVKKLALHPHFVKFLGKGRVPEIFPISFDHLRYMSLWADFDDIEVLQVILCLLRSTPNLQGLDVKGCYYHKEFPGVCKVFWKAQEHFGLFDNLQRVTVTNSFGAELDGFIQFVLSKARVLKTMRVSCPYGLGRKELLMFPRVSSQAKIIFTSGY